jgi:hypothetical protein
VPGRDASGRGDLEIPFAPILELEPRPRDEVFHGGGHEDLRRPCHPADACADVDRDATDLPVDRLDLSGVHAGADLEIEGPNSVDDRLRAPHGASRAVERREEAVSRRVDLDAVVARQDRSDRGVVSLDGLSPSTVAELDGLLRGPDDVREEHGREDPLERGLLLANGAEEPTDLLDHGRQVAVAGEMVGAVELDEPSPRDVASHVPPFLDGVHGFIPPMQDERRSLHRPEDPTDIGLALELVQRDRHPRTRRLTVIGGPEREDLAIEAGARGHPPHERLHEGRLCPSLLDRAIVRTPFLPAPRPGIVLVLQAAGERPEQDERRRSVRVRRREEDRQRAGRVHAEQRRSFRARGLHHRERVRDARLQRRKTVHRQRIGETRPTRVEAHDARERGELLQERTEGGQLPDQLDVRVGRADDHHVRGAVADDLIRDVGPVGGSRVMDVGDLHEPILRCSGGAGQTERRRR